MSGQPVLSDSSHLVLGFIFRTRMMATNPTEPSALTGPDVEEIMEVVFELEEFPSTLVTRKEKEKEKGSGKAPKAMRWATGKPRTSPRHARSPLASPLDQDAQEGALLTNLINWLPPFVFPCRPSM